MTSFLIVGLGNPGEKYAQTRHNVGFWLVDALVHSLKLDWSIQTKFKGIYTSLQLHDNKIHLLKPTTFMNLSGDSVSTISNFYQIDNDNIIVVHDELDLPCSTVKLKTGGGHGGHNGVRDIIAKIGKEFRRIRIGIGHPGNKNKVLDYVLQKPQPIEKELIDNTIVRCCNEIHTIASNNWELAINKLHSS